MSESSFKVLLIIGMLVVTSLAYQHLRSNWRQLNATSLLIFLIGWSLSLDAAIGKLTGGYASYVDANGETRYILSGLANFINHYSRLLVLLTCVGFLSYRLSRHRKSLHTSVLPVIALALVCVSAAADAAHGQPFFGKYFLPLTMLLISCTAAEPGRGAHLGAAYFTVSVALFSSIDSVFSFAGTTSSCPDRKCSAIGAIYTGIQTNGNKLGILLVCGLPFVLIVFTKWARLVISSWLGLFILLAGSRDSLVALIAVAVVAALTHPHVKNQILTGRFASVGYAVALTGLVVGVILPVTVTDPNAYTGRGYLWVVARGLVDQAPWMGNGATAWSRQVDIGTFYAASVYSPHNQWMDIAVASGALGLALWVALLLGIARTALGRGRWILLLPLTATIFAGLLESPLGFNRLDWMSWLLPAILLASPRQTRTPLISDTKSIEKEHAELIQELSDQAPGVT